MDTYVPWLTLNTYPDEILSLPCEKLTEVTPEINELAYDMTQTMYACKGIGLAAPQVGHSIRLFVMDCSKDESGLMYFINPVVTDAENLSQSNEGCLSFPGLQLQVERAREITVEARDIAFNEFEYKATGLEAVCIQHEIDHLDGITFLNRVSRQQRRHALRKWEKAKAKTNLNHTTLEI